MSEKKLVLFIDRYVIDATYFARSHPGGSEIIEKHSMKINQNEIDIIANKIDEYGMKYDCTREFMKYHSGISIIPSLIPAHFILSSSRRISIQVSENATAASQASITADAAAKAIDINKILNVNEFEDRAKEVLDSVVFAYYSGGAEDEISLKCNHQAYQQSMFKPKVLVNVSSVRLQSRLIFRKLSFSLPLMICSTALAASAHPSGDIGIAKACDECGIPFLVPHLASAPIEVICNNVSSRAILFQQLYLYKDKSKTLEFIKKVEQNGKIYGLFVTVDAAVVGKRERDLRARMAKSNIVAATSPRLASSDMWDNSFSWEDLDWLLKSTTLPVVLKGIQRADDAWMAIQKGCAGIQVSNHGGRNLDYSRATYDSLREINQVLNVNCKRHGISRDSFSIFVDGGIRRGSDIMKCMIHGADMCGIGRPSLYGLAVGGEEGVKRVINIFQDELKRVMQLTGIPNLEHQTCSTSAPNYFLEESKSKI